MLSPDQLALLITENENLQAQITELNVILAEREEALEMLKKSSEEVAELRSKLDLQQDEFQSMMEMQELHDNLLKEYAQSQAQLNDIQEQMLQLHHKNRLLQETASRIGELESDLANTIEERDLLKYRISLLRDSKNHNQFE